MWTPSFSPRCGLSSLPRFSAPSCGGRCGMSAWSAPAWRLASGRLEVGAAPWASGWTCQWAPPSMPVCWATHGLHLPYLPALPSPHPARRCCLRICQPVDHARSLRPAAGYLTQSIGMLTADASRGAFLSGFTVVVPPLMAGLFGTTRLKRTTWAAVVAALVGISLLEDSGAPASWGDFWSFASAVLFGVQVRLVLRCGSFYMPGFSGQASSAGLQPVHAQHLPPLQAAVSAGTPGSVCTLSRPAVDSGVIRDFAAELACTEGASPLLAPLVRVQIYRAEVWSKQLGAKSAMPMLSMSLLMIAGISLASTAAAHPQATLHVLGSPGQALAALAERR